MELNDEFHKSQKKNKLKFNIIKKIQYNLNYKSNILLWLE